MKREDDEERLLTVDGPDDILIFKARRRQRHLQRTDNELLRGAGRDYGNLGTATNSPDKGDCDDYRQPTNRATD